MSDDNQAALLSELRAIVGFLSGLASRSERESRWLNQAVLVGGGPLPVEGGTRVSIFDPTHPRYQKLLRNLGVGSNRMFRGPRRLFPAMHSYACFTSQSRTYPEVGRSEISA